MVVKKRKNAMLVCSRVFSFEKESYSKMLRVLRLENLFVESRGRFCNCFAIIECECCARECNLIHIYVCMRNEEKRFEVKYHWYR